MTRKTFSRFQDETDSKEHSKSKNEQHVIESYQDNNLSAHADVNKTCKLVSHAPVLWVSCFTRLFESTINRRAKRQVSRTTKKLLNRSNSPYTLRKLSRCLHSVHRNSNLSRAINMPNANEHVRRNKPKFTHPKTCHEEWRVNWARLTHKPFQSESTVPESGDDFHTTLRFWTTPWFRFSASSVDLKQTFRPTGFSPLSSLRRSLHQIPHKLP